MRIVYFLMLSLLFTASSAHACSCAFDNQPQLTSEFASRYQSFWGVPVKASLIPRATDRPGLILAYEVDIVEDFNRIGKDKIRIFTSIPDGGSCGRELNMGIPQFISAYKRGDGQLSVGTCTPDIPYTAIKSYLETGEDLIIPDAFFCKEVFDRKEKLSDCDVWTKTFKIDERIESHQDYLKYLVQWRDKDRE